MVRFYAQVLAQHLPFTNVLQRIIVVQEHHHFSDGNVYEIKSQPNSFGIQMQSLNWNIHFRLLNNEQTNIPKWLQCFRFHWINYRSSNTTNNEHNIKIENWIWEEREREENKRKARKEIGKNISWNGNAMAKMNSIHAGKLNFSTITNWRGKYLRSGNCELGMVCSWHKQNEYMLFSNACIINYGWMMMPHRGSSLVAGAGNFSLFIFLYILIFDLKVEDITHCIC